MFNFCRVFPKKIVHVVFLCLLPFQALFAADINLNVTASRQKIFLGESFILTILVDGADRGVPLPDLSALSKMDVQLLESRSASSFNISINNGRMTRALQKIIVYQITPKEKGRVIAGPVRLTIEGKIYTHPGVAIDVTGVEQQQFVVAKIVASSTSILVEEPFSVTLSIAVFLSISFDRQIT